MDEQERSMDDPDERSERMGKRLFLAWLGAMATAYDAAEDTFDQFVRRGEEVQEEFQGRRQEMQGGADSSARVRDSMRSVIHSLRSELDVPSKSEVDAINVKLNVVLRKLDDLTMESATPPASGQPEAPFNPIPPTEGDMAT